MQRARRRHGIGHAASNTLFQRRIVNIRVVAVPADPACIRKGRILQRRQVSPCASEPSRPDLIDARRAIGRLQGLADDPLPTADVSLRPARLDVLPNDHFQTVGQKEVVDGQVLLLPRGRPARKPDHHARLDRVSRDTAASHVVGVLTLEIPDLDLSVDFTLDSKPQMRIPPLYLRDRGFELHPGILVVFSSGMVRKKLGGQQEQNRYRQNSGDHSSNPTTLHCQM